MASPSPTLNLDTLTLTRGSHASPTDGACLMEAASWLAGEPWSDHPQCVSPVIGAFLRRWQDDLDDITRQTLKRYIPAVLGTNTGRADEDRRAWMVTDWMVRTYLPAWLRLGEMGDQADAVAALAELTDSGSWKAAAAVVDQARSRAAAAWDAAGAAAWAAARAAAGAAAGDAAGDAARAAAWAAAWDAAWAAAGDAAWAAAWAALKPTTTSLQSSARDLLDRLIEVGR